jgi:hypothetical protein
MRFALRAICLALEHHGRMQNFTFTAKLWLYSGKGAWHFVTVPQDAATQIRFFSPQAKGFMPLPVKATIGATTWKTSVFPDSKSGSYLLAIKAEVRKLEALRVDDVVEVSIAIET